MPAATTFKQEPIQSVFGKPTNPLSALARKLRTPRAQSRLNIAFSISAFTRHKQYAVEMAKKGNADSARFWAKQARHEWRVIAAWLGLPAPNACR